MKIFWEKRYLYGIYENENQIFNNRFKFNELSKFKVKIKTKLIFFFRQKLKNKW